jgi:hypothetical protein
MMLVRFLALHAAIGFGIATLFVTALLLADPGGLGTLLQPARSGLLPVCLLWLFSGLTFGAAQFAIALGLASGSEPRGGKGSLSVSPWAALRPARVPVVARAAGRPRRPLP